MLMRLRGELASSVIVRHLDKLNGPASSPRWHMITLKRTDKFDSRLRICRLLRHTAFALTLPV
jgi:hypothetical protein